MDEMTAFERQLSDQIRDLMGPAHPVDDLAVFGTIAEDRSQGWGFMMLSALKYAVAGVIVALAGGFALAGLFATPARDQVVPAAVPASPSPLTTRERLAGMVTEEVEPGVYRIINDGVRDLAPEPYARLVAGQDGSIWFVGPDSLARLGRAGSLDWRVEDSDDWLNDLEVAADGTVWATIVSVDGTDALRSFDGQSWTTHSASEPLFDDRWPDLEVTPGGKVWAVRVDGTLGYLGDDSSWHTVAVPRPGPDYFQGFGFTATDTDVWVPNYDVLWHYGDGTWERISYGGPDAGELPEGVYWAIDYRDDDMLLSRHDETGWQQWSLREQGMFPGFWFTADTLYSTGPDSGLWAGWALWGEGDGESDSTDRCAGVTHFDGLTWTRFLPGMCVQDIAATTDGSVWLRAYEAPDLQSEPTGPFGWYVITPEALAARNR